MKAANTCKIPLGSNKAIDSGVLDAINFSNSYWHKLFCSVDVVKFKFFPLPDLRIVYKATYKCSLVDTGTFADVNKVQVISATCSSSRAKVWVD